MSAASSHGSRSFLDAEALMSIRNLELRARNVVEGFWHGLHRSPYHGFSVEFTEYRPYVIGDDLRHLDWRLVARTDRFFIKKFEDETNLRCHLVVDRSRSMDFKAKAAWTKSDYAATLAATLAYFLSQQGDAVGLLAFDEVIRDYLPARNRPGHQRQLMLALEKGASGASTELGGPLRRMAELMRKRGLVVIISDLLAPLPALEAGLALLTASGHEVVLFQVLDRGELDFDFPGATRFLDLETGHDLFLDPAHARAGYQRRLQAHLRAVGALCQRLGISHQQLITDQPLETALFDFLKLRAERGKRVIRRRAAS